jgi:DNA-directed RNA polymerase specialized sigma24 family protein
MNSSPTNDLQAGSAFPPTLWTQLMNVHDDACPEKRRQTLEALCRSYWQPLFHYARRLGNSFEHSQDVTQGFFCHLFDSELKLLKQADRTKGRLRTLLLTAFSRYIRGEYDKSIAAKRGGPDTILSLDGLMDAESRELTALAEGISPEQAYDAEYARQMIKASMRELEKHYEAKGWQKECASLMQYLLTSGDEKSYSEEAAKLGIRLGNYKMRVQRIRPTWRAILMELVKKHMPDGTPNDEIELEVWEIIRLAGG